MNTVLFIYFLKLKLQELSKFKYVINCIIYNLYTIMFNNCYPKFAMHLAVNYVFKVCVQDTLFSP